MQDVVTAILGGGQGTRLWPLTRDRAKPAVPVAGKFRLIDIPISNSLHAGIDRIFVLTQFNSASLHRHIAQAYRFDMFSQGFVHILAAEQSLGNRDWYQGTADAVRQNLRRLVDHEPREVVILSGDQLYLMDLKGLIAEHRRQEADITIAVKPVSTEEAPALGLLRLDEDGQLVEFVEKPQEAEVIGRFALDEATVAATGVNADPGSLLASMGIYVFRTEVLARLLSEYRGDDFGRDLIPQAIKDFAVYGFSHRGYWRDIGTIGTFHQASLELTHQLPALNLYDASYPIYSRPRFLPGSKITECSVYESILSDGCLIEGSRVTSSIVGVRGVVHAGSVLERTVMMGADFFEATPPPELPALGIGHGCYIRNAIIDKNARIGDGARLFNEANLWEEDGPNWYIRDGVVVVPRNEVIPPGTVV